jgi:hypothetical protein
VDGCGQYFTVSGTQISSDPGRCNSITVVGGQNGNVLTGTTSPIVPQLGSQPFLQGNGTFVPHAKGQDASDSGQFGLAFRFPVDKIDTEIGLYAMNIHSRLPLTSSRTGTNPNDIPEPYRTALTQAGFIGNDAYGPFWRSGPTSATLLRSLLPSLEKPLEAATGGAVDLKPAPPFWEYPEDIQIYGISAATNLFGWSTSAEISHQIDVPVQINGNDLVAAGVFGIGPYRDEARVVQNSSEGGYLQGWDQFDKTQAQLNVVKTFSNLLGAQTLLIVGEVGGQWNNMDDYTKGGIRYGRGFMFGTASTPELTNAGTPNGNPTILGLVAGNTCSPTSVALPVPFSNPFYNAQPNGCRNDGFVTDMAWGYRLRVSADYNNVRNTGVTVTPSVFWSQDVEGVSMDPQFVEDRSVLGLGLKFNYNKKYVLDLNYVEYGTSQFDPLFDRDYYSAAVSVTF